MEINVTAFQQPDIPAVRRDVSPVENIRKAPLLMLYQHRGKKRGKHELTILKNGAIHFLAAYATGTILKRDEEGATDFQITVFIIK